MLNLTAQKETIINAFFILLCLALFFFFPVTEVVQSLIRSLFFLLLVPVLYIKIILKKSLADFGLRLPQELLFLYWSAGALIISLLLAILLTNLTSFTTGYSLPVRVVENFWAFLVYELVITNMLFFLQEAFFKGFVLSIFRAKFGFYAIAISAVLFSLFLFLSGNLSWQTAPLLILSVTGGILAYKTRSFIYSYLMGLVFLIIFDAYLIYIIK